MAVSVRWCTPTNGKKSQKRAAAAPPSFAREMSVPLPTEAEALSVLADLRRTINPETGQPFVAENSRADPVYVRAALAVLRCHPGAQKENGEPNYSGAARMCMRLDPGKPRSNSAGGLVKSWVTKLERFEHVRSQTSLATDLGQMCPEELPGDLLSLGALTEGPPSSFNIASPPMTATSEHESDGQAKVRIESDGSTAAPLTGKRVLIKGVVARPELNGTHGTTLKWLGDERGRYGVRLGDGTEVALKPVNLEEARDQSVDEDLESLPSLFEWCEKHSRLQQDQGPVGSDEEDPLVAQITQGVRSVSTNDEPFPELGALVTIHDGGPAARVGRLVAAADDEHYEVAVGESNETVHISHLREYIGHPAQFLLEVGRTDSMLSDAAHLKMLRESHTPCLGLRTDDAGIWQAFALREIKGGEKSHYSTLADIDCPSTEYVNVQMVMLGPDRSILAEFKQDHLGELFLVKRELYEVNIAEPSWSDFAASSSRRINLNVGEMVGVRTRLQIEAMIHSRSSADPAN